MWGAYVKRGPCWYPLPKKNAICDFGNKEMNEIQKFALCLNAASAILRYYNWLHTQNVCFSCSGGRGGGCYTQGGPILPAFVFPAVSKGIVKPWSIDPEIQAPVGLLCFPRLPLSPPLWWISGSHTLCQTSRSGASDRRRIIDNFKIKRKTLCGAWIYRLLLRDSKELQCFSPLEMVENCPGERLLAHSVPRSCKSSFPWSFFFPPAVQTPRFSSLQTHGHHGEADGVQTPAFDADPARSSPG